MSWLKKKLKKDAPIREDLRIEPAPQSRVEIELHKSASSEAKQKVDVVNAHVKDLLEQNGFTIKIALAAGYNAPHNRKKNR